MLAQNGLEYDGSDWEAWNGDDIGTGTYRSALDACVKGKGDLAAIEKERAEAKGGSWLGRGALDLIAGTTQNLAVYVRRKLQEPTNCITCLVVVYSAIKMEDIAIEGFNIIAWPCLIFVMALFGIWVLLKLVPVVGGMTSAQSMGGWQPLLGGFCCFVLVLVFLGVYVAKGGNDKDRVDNSFADYMFKNIVAPGLSIGAGMGTAITDHIIASGSPDLKRWMDNPDPNCQHSGCPTYREQVIEGSYQTLASYKLVDPNTLAKIKAGTNGIGGMTRNLLGLTAVINFVGAMGMSRAAGYLGDAQKSRGAFSGAFSALIGILLLMAFVTFMLYGVLRLVDPLIRLMTILALSPVLAISFVFPSTRQVATTGMRGFLYAVAYLAVCGVVYSIVVQFLMVSFVSDISGAGTQTVAEFLNDLAEGTDALLPSGKLDVVKPLLTFLIVSIGIAVLAYVPQLAGLLSGYSGAGGIGDEIRNTLQGLGRTGISVGVHGAMAAGGRIIRTLT